VGALNTLCIYQGKKTSTCDETQIQIHDLLGARNILFVHIKFFLDFDTVALSFLFDKHYQIMEQLGLKNSSRNLQLNCAISYLFYLCLMFHACATRFDVMGNLVKFWVFWCI